MKSAQPRTSPTRSLLYSDLHLDENSAHVVLTQVLPGILALAIEHKCQHIICLGDFYHMRYRVSVKLQNAVVAWLYECHQAGITTTFLPGNHDQVDAAGENALQVLSHIDGVSVLTKPTVRDDGCWMPYRPELSQVVADVRRLAESRDPSTPPLLFLHYGVRGALQNNVTEDTDGVEPGLFEELGFAKVFCGHYHKPQMLAKGRVQYLGSPYQTRADEAGQQKGVYVLEGVNLKFLPQLWGRKFYKTTVQSWADCEAFVKENPHITADDDVRITLDCKDIDPQAAFAWMQQHGLNKVIVTPVVRDFERRLDIEPTSDLVSYARAYMEAHCDDSECGVPGDQLWETFEAIREKAKPVSGGGVL